MVLFARIAAALVSGVLLAQSYGLAPVWPLAWIAPVPLLIAVMGASPAVTLLCGAIAGAVSGAGMFDYLLNLGGPIPAVMLASSRTLTWAGAALAVRAAARGLPAAAAVLVLPSLMAGVETLVAAASPHGTAGALAYSQMNFLPAIQVAALGGAPAITFATTLFASVAAFLLARRAFGAALVPTLIISAALGYGVLRLRTPASDASLSVSLLAEDRLEGVPDDWRRVWREYAAQVERAADRGSRVVLLPEKIAHLGTVERDEAVERLAGIAHRRGVQLVFGVDVDTANGRFNRAYVARPNSPLASYDKQRMVPGLESHFTTGRSRLQLGEPPERFGYAVCKDMDFPAAGRAYATTRVVFVPAWDFEVDAWLHSRMAVLRGVESGFAVARSARNGVLTVSDAYGRVLADAPSGPRATLDAQVPLRGPGPTLYARIGDSFGWGCLAATGGLLAWTLTRRRAAALAFRSRGVFRLRRGA